MHHTTIAGPATTTNGESMNRSPLARSASIRRNQTLCCLTGLLLAIAAAPTADAADFTVTTTADSGPGSLRQAIDDASASTGSSRIVFAIPEGECSAIGVCEIALSSPLPDVTNAVDIDGRTQPRFGSAPANVCAGPAAVLSPRIQIWGDVDYILRVTSEKPVRIRGFAMGGADNLVLVENGGNVSVQCNLFGASVDGTAASNHSAGVCLACYGSAAAPSIIGTDGDGIDDEAEGNVFEGGSDGVNINTGGGHVIAGNWFGLRRDGTSGDNVPSCVYMRQHSGENLVGSNLDGISDELERNVFGTCWTGVGIESYAGSGDGNRVVGNWFGIDAFGDRADVRTGVRLTYDGQDHVVGHNRFEYNRQAIDLNSDATLATDSVSNCLENNVKGLIHRGTANDLFAASNWWGDPSGPSGAGAGTGDEIEILGSGSVLFTPWLTSPPASCGEVSPDSYRMVIPAAAIIQGVGGASFETDLEVHNHGSAAAGFVLKWLPRDTDNSVATESEIFTLAPGASRRFANVLGTVFGLDEVAGALLVASDSADLAAMSRTFNRSADGTFGQSLPGVAEGEMVAATNRVRVLFMDENDGFRSNLGLANGSDRAVTVRYELFSAEGQSLGTGERVLAPWGNTQINRVFRPYQPIEAGYADVWTDTAGGVFTCYGSVIDNQSSDPTTVLP